MEFFFHEKGKKNVRIFFFFAFYFQIDEFVNDDAHIQLNRKCCKQERADLNYESSGSWNNLARTHNSTLQTVQDNKPN